MSRAEEIVKTIDGTEAPRSECRYIKGDFYLVGDPHIKDSGQCFRVNDRYYRLSTGYIVYDELKQEYVLKNESVISGIIGFNEDGSFIMGNFSRDNLKNVNLVDRSGMGYTVMNESIMKGTREYKYDKSRDRYAHISSQDAVKFNKLRTIDYGYKTSLTYDCRDVIGRYTDDYNRSTLEISKNVKSYAPLLKGLTFGLEFETVRGVVPDRITRGLGLIPLRDGSIDGLEYATIPLSGEKGLQAAIESCKALEKFTEYDDSCSLHLHMGGVPRTEEYLLALFKVLCLVQDEFFEMFPIYKKYNFGVKRKNYTQPFDAITMMNQMDKTINSSNIKENFDVLYRFLSRGQSYPEVGNNLSNVKGHPSDPRGTSKWNITSRYFWVNLIPIVFGNKQTIEFRIHTPTTDHNKTLHYIYICGAILNYVRDNQDVILRGGLRNKLSLHDIIVRTYSTSSQGLVDALLDYISERKRSVASDNHEGNIRGDEKKISVDYFDWANKEVLAKKTLKTRRGSRDLDEMERLRRVWMELERNSMMSMADRVSQPRRSAIIGRVETEVRTSESDEFGRIWLSGTDSNE